MSVGRRKLQLLVLVLVFFAQTWRVYSDPAGRVAPPLSEEAARGRQLWHEHNCQSCHQLFGFGGFLGPDLTNVSPTLTDARLESILTVGSGQMPPLDLDAPQRHAIRQFLDEIHETGVGQLRLVEPAAPRDILDQTVEVLAAGDQALTPEEQTGRQILHREGCIDCHLPNERSTFKAPDLGGLLARLGPDGVFGIVSAGIPPKGMPRFQFDEREREGLMAILDWLRRNGTPVHEAFVSAAAAVDGATGDLPWFEFP